MLIRFYDDKNFITIKDFRFTLKGHQKNDDHDEGPGVEGRAIVPHAGLYNGENQTSIIYI